MKYEIGQIVVHKLTAERFIVLGLLPGLQYRCAGENYGDRIFEEVEIEPAPSK